ncbi:MAG: hypothetical protein EA402_03530 [Planctomycetota bacterium]|nr:MAG: hypothetical protein EA402_03530 [Planctomycetota bacterium]
MTRCYAALLNHEAPHDPLLFACRVAVGKAVAQAGYGVTACADEAALMRALSQAPHPRPLADTLHMARASIDAAGMVFLVAHVAEAARCRWLRPQDLRDPSRRPSAQAIADPQLAIELQCIAEHRGWGAASWQVLLDEADAVAALADGRWGSAKDALHPVYVLRREQAHLGVAMRQRHARQADKANLRHEWDIALREEDLPPATAHLHGAVSILACATRRHELPLLPHSDRYMARFAAALRRDLGLAPHLAPAGQQALVPLAGLGTRIRQYVALAAFFGLDAAHHGWDPIPLSAITTTAAIRADVVRQQRREACAAVAHYLGARAGIAQKRAWKTALTAVERFQERLFAEADAQGDGKGLRERVTTMATRAGVSPSTARLMLLHKAPESFERLEYLMNAYGLTFAVQPLGADEEAL